MRVRRFAVPMSVLHLEDRVVPVKDLMGNLLLDQGFGYWYGEERIPLYIRADEVALEVSATNASTLADLPKQVSALTGFQLRQQLSPTLAIFSQPEMTPGAQLGVDYATRLANLAQTPGVVSASPVYANETRGTWSVSTGETIVRLAPGLNPTTVLSQDARFGDWRPLWGTPDQFVVTVKAGPGNSAVAASEAIKSLPGVVWSSPNFYSSFQRMATTNDPLINKQWHLNNTGQYAGATVDADADVFEAWDVTFGGSSTVTVAVVDDGMEFTHPDLAPNLFVNTGEIAGNGKDDDNNGWVDDVNGWDFTTNGTNGDNNPGADGPNDAHATAVAGVAAGKGNNGLGTSGVAFNSKILPVRIFGTTGAATTDANIASAVNYAAGRTKDGLGMWKPIDVMNNSWGGGAVSNAIKDAFTWASGSGRGGLGTVSFIANGNSGAAAVSFPATLAGTISGVVGVGASNDLDVRSNYSQYGPEMDFVAPSSGGIFGIVTVDRQGTNGYNTASGTAGDYTNTAASAFGGTSSATPLSAGIGALILGLNPNLKASEVRGLMRNTTDYIGPGSIVYGTANGFNGEYGYGRVNAFTAVSGVGKPEIQVIDGRTDVPTNGTAVNFGTINVGSYVSRTFRIRNQGTLPLNLGQFAITGPFILETGISDFRLAVGEMTTLTVRFLPTANGPATGQLTFLTNDSDESNFVVNLNGTGTAVSLSGYVFEDINGDGIFQATEPGLVGQQVKLNGATVATTDAKGYYSFASVAPGSHSVNNPAVAGWNRTTLDTFSLTLAAGDSKTGFNFGLGKQDTAYGRVVVDLNNNGIVEPSEQGLPNWTVFNDVNNNNAIDFAPTKTYASGVINLPIPVGAPTATSGTMSHTIAVAATGTIADVNVLVNVTHTWNSDLRFTLFSPDGTSSIIINAVGGSSDNFTNTILDDQATTPIASGTAPFTGTFIPSNPLSVFNGKSIAGNWKLQIDDLAAGDWGTLINWEVRIIDNSGEAFVLSDSNGNYRLPMAVGAANIRTVQQPTWTPTTPASGKYSFTHTAGTTRYANHFGQRKDTNTPPADPNAGGPYSITEGDSLTLIGSATDADGDALLFSWDVNGDGTFGDAFGANVTLTWAQLEALGLSNGPLAKTVSMKVTDVISPWLAPVTNTLDISNAKPTATGINATTPVTEFSSSTVTLLSPTDPSTADKTAGLRFAFDFGNDNTWEIGGPTYALADLSNSATVPDSFLNDNGIYTVRVRVIDQNDGFNDYITTITVTNVRPTATSFTNGGSVVEGSTGTVTLNGATDVSPVDMLAGLRYAFDFGGDGVWDLGTDGLSWTNSITSNSVTVPASFLDDGTKSVPVIVRVFDKDNDFSEYTTSISVTNAKPTATLDNAGVAYEGLTSQVFMVNPFDPSQADTLAGFKYSFDFNNDNFWDLGDGLSYTGSKSTSDPTIPASFLAEGPGTLTVRARIFDKDGSFSNYTTTITIENSAPTATFANSGNVSVGIEPSVIFSGLQDSKLDLGAGLKYFYDFDNDGVFDVGTNNPIASYTDGVDLKSITVPLSFVPDVPATITIRGRVIDRNNGYTDYVTNLDILNVAPTATLASGGSVTENTPGQVSFANQFDVSASDRNAGFRYAYDFDNDGKFDLGDGKTFAGSSPDSSVTVPAKYLSNGPFTRTVRARIIDQNDGFTDYTTTIEVANLPPSATFSGTTVTTEGDTATILISNATDPSPDDTKAGFRYAIDFDGDGVWDLGKDSYAKGISSTNISIPASFLADGTRTLDVRIRMMDRDDGFSNYTRSVLVQGVAPTAKLLNLGPVQEGQTATILVTDRNDASQDDLAAGLRYSYDFDNDGKFEIGDGTFAKSSLVPSETVPAKYLTDSTKPRTVRVRIIDKDNDYRDITTEIGITNVAPTASLVASSGAIVGTPTLVTFQGATDPSPEDINSGLLFSFDFNNNGSYTDAGDILNSKSPFASVRFPVPGSYVVRGKVADAEGAFTGYTTTVAVRNVPPTAMLVNSGDVREGGQATVSLLNVNHPSQQTMNAGIRFAYDFNNDGTFDLGTGLYATSLTVPSAAVPAELLAEGPISRTIRVRVMEVNGLFTEYTTTLQVTNVAPTMTFSVGNGSEPLFRNTPIAVRFSNATDPSASDARNLKFRVELTTPGTIQFDPSTGLPVSVSLVQAGRQVIRGIVTDPNGAETVYEAQVTVQSQNWYAVGPDDNRQPTVNLYNRQGEVQLSKAAFGDWVTGGVRVATADFNADGIPDLLAGTGPGVMGQARILDGNTGQILGDFMAFEELFTGGVFVATGDITGDGVSDFVISPDQGGGPRVRIFDGRTFKQIADFFGIDDENFRGGARATLGDLNGDGRADLIVSAGFGGGPRIAGFDGLALTQGKSTRLFADFFAYEAGLRNGAYVSAGDIDGDGKAELVTGGGPGGGPRVRIFAPSMLMENKTDQTIANFFAGNQENRGGVRTAVKDLDGDGQAEIITGSGTNGGSEVTVFSNTRGQGLRVQKEFEAFDDYSGGVFVG